MIKLLTTISLCLTLGLSLSAQNYFQDVSVSAGIDHYSSFATNEYAMGGGVAWLDYNNDGWLDLYITGGYEHDLLYLNNQNSTFTDVSLDAGVIVSTDGVMTNGVSVSDINRDGYEDILVTTNHMSANLLFVNNGDGSFTESGAAAGIDDVVFSTGIAVGDVNQDGWPDLYYPNYRVFDEFGGQIDAAYPDRLYLNNGDGTFSDMTTEYGLYSVNGCGLAASFSDFDFDGDADLLLGNDYGFEPWTDQNGLFRNDQGVFEEVSVASNFNIGMNAMGIAAADFDEDQDLDYYITNVGSNVLLRNDEGVFLDVANVAGVESQWPVPGVTDGEESYSWGAGFFDFDNDTYVDLFCSNGYLSASIEADDMSRMYRNVDASGTFEDITNAAGLGNLDINRGCAFADFDNDGDVDLFLVTQDTIGGAKRSGLMENVTGNTNNWLHVKLVGVESNIDALGSLVRVYVDDRVLIREVDSGGASYNSHHSKTLHFGLGQYASIDSLVVTWPNGNSQEVSGLSINESHVVIEESAPVSAASSDSGLGWDFFPNPCTDMFYVKSDNGKVASLKIYDALGRVLISKQLGGGTGINQIDASFLSAGIYTLSLDGNTYLLVKN